MGVLKNTDTLQLPGSSATQSAAQMSQLSERLGEIRTRRAGEQADVVHALLALEDRRTQQMCQYYDLVIMSLCI